MTAALDPPRSDATRAALDRIAHAALYWWERPDWPEPQDWREPDGWTGPAATPGPSGDAPHARWTEVVADGDDAVFRRRLRWATEDRPARSAASDERPGWIDVLADVVAEHASEDAVSESPPTGPAPPASEPYPFEGVLTPAIRVARARLSARLARSAGAGTLDAPSPEVVLPQAQDDLERDLLRRLSGLVAPSLYAEFCEARPPGILLYRAFADSLDDPPAARHYAAFVASMAAGGLLAHFEKYPVVARLVGTTLENWVERTAELLERFDADVAEIHASLLSDPGCGDDRIASVEPSLSDAHRGQRSVAVLSLSCGHKVVYKPRDLRMEAAFHAIVEWADRRSREDEASALGLRAPRVLTRQDYGWMEHIEHLPCADEAAAARYFARAGSLLALLHALRATDCHHGNVVACGEYPVLVDAETLLHPTARPLEPGEEIPGPGSAERGFYDSVLRTLLLPVWRVSADGRFAYDVSGLGGGPEQRVESLPQWRWVNTDGMALQYRAGAVPGEKNVVRVGDLILSATEHASQVEAGFAEMYRCLVGHREDLLGADLLGHGGLLAQMRDLPVRFLFRDTRIYQGVVAAARGAEHTTSGLRFSIELDALSRALVQGEDKPAAWPVLAAELRALGSLDIPYFLVRTSTDSLAVRDDETVPHYLVEAAHPAAVRQIQRLSEEDLRWQISLIRGSFQAQLARTTRTAERVPDPAPPRTLEAVEMITEADRLAEELARRCIDDGRGGATWLGLGLVAETERVQLELIGDSLYAGRCGVGLFLAALAKVTGAPGACDLLSRTLATVRRSARASPPDTGTRGAMIYALVTIGQILDGASLDRASLDDASLDGEEPTAVARGLAQAWPEDDVAADRGLDVLSGAAGAILGLLALARTTGDDAALARATAFGHHLLRHRVSHRGSPKAWLTIGERPLTGFSHGAAGIAYALLRLSDLSGEPAFREAALEGVEYERSVFSPIEGNWPDLREPDAPTYPDQWCHGAAGIALARLGMRSLVTDTALDEEIATALATTRRGGLRIVDHLCCGNMGRIEALWVGSRRLDRADWRRAARDLASQVLDRARAAGTYQLFPNLPADVFNPGFFRGVAGIGYQWLRLADPTLPSVLLWE